MIDTDDFITVEVNKQEGGDKGEYNLNDNAEYKEQKKKSSLISETLYVNERSNQAWRMRVCCDSWYLEERTNKSWGSGYLLKSAYPCRERLCPVCGRTRARGIRWNINRIVEKVSETKDLEYLSLTLTVENCDATELESILDNMTKGFRRLLKYKVVADVVVGWAKTLEVKYNNERRITNDMWNGNAKKHIKPRKYYYIEKGLAIGDPNPNFDMYHPHLHVTLGVVKWYSKRGYIKKHKWENLWKKACRLDYNPTVYITTVYKEDESINDKEIESDQQGSKIRGKIGIAKAINYSVKELAYTYNSKADTRRVIGVIDKNLRRRHLVSYGGVFKKANNELFSKNKNTTASKEP